MVCLEYPSSASCRRADGPFREALDSNPSFGDKSTYQMDPSAQGTGEGREGDVQTHRFCRFEFWNLRIIFSVQWGPLRQGFSGSQSHRAVWLSLEFLRLSFLNGKYGFCCDQSKVKLSCFRFYFCSIDCAKFIINLSDFFHVFVSLFSFCDKFAFLNLFVFLVFFMNILLNSLYRMSSEISGMTQSFPPTQPHPFFQQVPPATKALRPPGDPEAFEDWEVSGYFFMHARPTPCHQPPRGTARDRTRWGVLPPC